MVRKFEMIPHHVHLRIFLAIIMINLCFAGIMDWIQDSWHSLIPSHHSHGIEIHHHTHGHGHGHCKRKRRKKPKVVAIHVPKINYVPIEVLPALKASKLHIDNHVHAHHVPIKVGKFPHHHW